MIVAEQKPFKEISESLEEFENVLVLGCGTCVTVCMAGGEKEAGVLSKQLKLAAKNSNATKQITDHTITRQCDREFFDEVTAKKIKEADVVLSMGCGVGVQYLAEVFTDTIVRPALNTKFYGANIQQGIWSERCAGCGECVLDKYEGICPVARCSKSLMNGPCGGSSDGMCEVDPENIDCGWQLIYDRMKKLNMLDKLTENQPAKDWSTNRDGGPRKVVRKDVLFD